MLSCLIQCVPIDFVKKGAERFKLHWSYWHTSQVTASWHVPNTVHGPASSPSSPLHFSGRKCEKLGARALMGNNHNSALQSRRLSPVEGRVVQKPVNANPGLKVNRSINFSCIDMFFTAYVLCSLRLLKLKREGQTTQTENLNEKLQN